MYAFGDAADRVPSTRVHWELEPVPEGTRVRLRHSGFTGLKGWMMRQGMNNGWGLIVRRRIPYAVERVRAGQTPTREQVRASGKAAR